MLGHDEVAIEDYTILPLPGGITTAGEWYWAMPTYTAAPDTGREIIEMLTNEEAEFNRLCNGVGLPTLKVHYQARGEGEAASFGSIGLDGFQMPKNLQERLKNGEAVSVDDGKMRPGTLSDLAALYENSAIHRSRLEGYVHVAQELGFYIKKAANWKDPEGSRSSPRDAEKRRIIEMRQFVREIRHRLERRSKSGSQSCA